MKLTNSHNGLTHDNVEYSINDLMIVETIHLN